MKDFSRAERVAEQVKSELATAILREIDDPRLQQVTLMAVRMTDGLEAARIFWLPLNLGQVTDREKSRIDRAFRNATPYLRSHLASKLRLRIVPDLHFEYDKASERGRHMEELIKRVREEDAINYPDLVPSDEDASDEDTSDD